MFFCLRLLRFSIENNNNSWFTDETIRRQHRSGRSGTRRRTSHTTGGRTDGHRQVVEVILSAAAAAATALAHGPGWHLPVASASRNRHFVAFQWRRVARNWIFAAAAAGGDGRANKIDPRAANLQRGRQRQKLYRRRRRPVDAIHR